MSARFGSLAQALAFQQTVHGSSIELGLTRVRAVAERLGLCEPRCPSIIVGGTNGKGSTATMLAALLQACGHRVGLFTSPHLLRYNERIRIDGVEAGDEQLLRVFERIEAVRGETTLTFFEYNTLAALAIFRSSEVTAMVLEVGLGGRLDATNIIDADVAVLCSVGMDHRDWLGDTIELIGFEKAGIFRAYRPVVLGSADMPASVWQRLESLECPVQVAGRDFAVRLRAGEPVGRWDYSSGHCRLESLPPPALAGAVQYANAATAITALNLLPVEGACDAARVGSALASVRVPGRFQIVPGRPEWILDVAHNEPAAAVLAAALRDRPCPGRTLVVLGMLGDKDVAAVAHALDGVVDHWLLAGLEAEPRGLSVAALQARLPVLRGTVEPSGDIPRTCARARELAQKDDRVVVLGSFHAVGPALAWLGLY